MKKSIFVDTVTCLLIILFLYTGLYKTIHHEDFASTIINAPLITPYYLFISYAIPAIELLITAGLLTSLVRENAVLRKWSLLASAILMATFTWYVWYMLKFSPRLPCSCGGIIDKMNWHQHLYFNTTFTILSILAFIMNRKQYMQTEKLPITA